jgi:hypothetical protein
MSVLKGGKPLPKLFLFPLISHPAIIDLQQPYPNATTIITFESSRKGWHQRYFFDT